MVIMSRRIPLLLFLLALVSFGSMYYLFQLKYGSDNTISRLVSSIAKRSPSPKPQIPLNSPPPQPLVPDTGTAGTYTISVSAKTGPIFTTLSIDPLTDELKKDITVKVNLKSSKPIQSITANVQSDTSSVPLKLKLVTRDGENETWEGKYQLQDSANYTYILNFEAKDDNGTNKYSLPLRS